MKKISSVLITAFVFVLGLAGIASAESQTSHMKAGVGKGSATDRGKVTNLEPAGKMQDLSGKIDNLGQDKLTDLERTKK